jgi:hypothetical protein
MSRQSHSEKLEQRNDNVLVGWLVSYALDPYGAVFELRSGRTFVGADGGVSDRSIELDDSTISSPHLALNASPEHKVMIQDIFSDFGTFIKRSNTNEEVRVSGPMSIQHGDWIRIGGNVRVQVCLLDGARK